MASVTTGSFPVTALSSPAAETKFRVPPVRKDRVLTWASFALPPAASMFLRRMSCKDRLVWAAAKETAAREMTITAAHRRLDVRGMRPSFAGISNAIIVEYEQPPPIAAQRPVLFFRASGTHAP